MKCKNCNNVIHRNIFYSGFLDKNNYPSGYNCVYDKYYTEISKIYYLKVLRTLCDKNFDT